MESPSELMAQLLISQKISFSQEMKNLSLEFWNKTTLIDLSVYLFSFPTIRFRAQKGKKYTAYKLRW